MAFHQNPFNMDSDDGYQPRFNKLLYVTVFSVSLSAFSMGAATAWSSPAIPRLNGLIDPEANPLRIPITTEEEVAIVSLLLLGAIISAILSRYSINRFGRKITLLTSAVPNIIGFFCLGIATERSVFYIGRFLIGLSVGIVFSVAPTYVREIGDRTNRKCLSCWLMLSINLGSLFVYSIAPFCSLKTLSKLNIFPPVIFLFTFGVYSPESPYFYVARHRMYSAWISLKKLRCDNERIVDDELLVIQKHVVESYADLTSLQDFLNHGNLVRKMFIASGLIIFYQLTGINAIFFYMESIFHEVEVPLAPGTCTIIVASAQIIGSIFALCAVDKIKRRLILLMSSIGMGILQFCFALYLYLDERYINMERFELLPIVCISLFVWICSWGFLPFAVIVSREIFPPFANSLTVFIEILLMLTSTLVVAAIFPAITELLGMEFAFGMFAVCCILATAFIYAFVPETKSKEHREAQNKISEIGTRL